MPLRPCARPVAICLTALVLLAMAGAVAGCGATRIKAKGGAPLVTQAEFEAQIRQDRAELVNGRLSYTAPQTIAVSATGLLTVTVQWAKTDEPEPPGQAQPHITLKVGGVEGATLTAAAGSLTITRAGPATGTIAQRGDAVTWTWDLTPRHPGPIVLDLVVVTYEGDTTVPLYTLHPPLAIRLRAVSTLGSQARTVGSTIVSIAAVTGSIAGAIVAVAGCVAGVVHWRRRRKDRRRKKAARPEHDVTAPAEGTTPAVKSDGPTKGA